MSKPRMHDRLSALAGEPLPRDPNAAAPVDDTTRILSLPRRPIVSCERDPVTKQYPPATQALIEVMTAQFARPPRVSCACRPRRISMMSGGWLTITRVLPEGMPPEPPRIVALQAFIADSRADVAAVEVARRVAQLRPGEAYDAPSADGSVTGAPCITQLNPVQAWTLREAPLAGGILGFKGVGSGKCVRSDTEIFDYKNGRRRSVQESGSLEVASFDGNALAVQPASAFPSGTKECFDLTLADGTKLGLSFDHKVLTHRGWIEAQYLTRADFVAVPAVLPEPAAGREFSDDEVVLAALMLAGGGCERAKEEIWGLPRRQVALFLRHFWACAGHVSEIALECTLVSEKLLDDIRFLLLRVGIRSRKRLAAHDAWHISVSDKDALTFLNEIGDVRGNEERCRALRQHLELTKQQYAHLGVSDLAWERVASLERVGEQPVYDLSVPVTHNFVANNVVVHNTISGLLAPLCFPDARLAVLVMEPKQRAHYRSHYFRLREHFRVSTIVFDDGTSGQTVPGTVPLHLISYSVLSQTKNSSLLDDYRPEVVILDEAHRACGDSAINRRVKRYILGRIKGRQAALDRGDPVLSRAVFLLDWSGTLENKSAQDTQMLSAYSLGDGSPLPLDPDVAVAYSAVMDVSRNPDRESPLAKRLQSAFGSGPASEDPLVSLVSQPERAVRKGFQKWRAETLGVITGAASSINASIYFGERDPGKIPDLVREALRAVRDDSVRPDGEILEDRLRQVGCAREIGSGFYNYWAFPEKCECTPGAPRCSRCLKIDDWFAKRKAYAKERRAKLLLGERNLDSPKLCEDAAKRYWSGYKGDLPVWACESWPAWAEVENTVEHIEKVRWIGDGTPEAADPATHPGYFVARSAVEWALKNKGVVWFRSTALGRKIAELSGLPYFNGGPGCEERLRAERGNRSVILSIKALGAGTDGLQLHFDKQLICEMPASNGGNEGAEQLLGRLHREGQRADVIETFGFFHIVEFRDAFRQAHAQAQFNREMLNLKQRILLADLDLEWF